MKRIRQTVYVLLIIGGFVMLPLAFATEVSFFSALSTIGNSSPNDLDGLFKDHSCQFTIAATNAITVNIQGNLGDTGDVNFINALSSDHTVITEDRDTWKIEINDVLMKNMLLSCVANCDGGNTITAYCRSK